MTDSKPPTSRFNEEKAAIAAALFIHAVGENRRLNYMKLLKLMYILDRTAIIRRGHPVIGGNYGSMDFGPVPLNSYNLVKSKKPPESWSKVIGPPGADYEVARIEMPDSDLLSDSEMDMIDEVARQYGNMAPFILSDFTHKPDEFPEWTNPHDSMIPISWEEILKRVGKKSQQEIDEILRDAAEMERMSAIFGD